MSAVEWAGVGVQAGGSLFGNIGSKKRLKRAYKLQSELQSQQAKENYEYGEMAADSAHDRSLALLEAETAANSYEAQIKDITAAGVSPGVLGNAGGGSAGGGAQGDGARGIQPMDIAAIMQAENEAKAINNEKYKQTAESILLKAEADKAKAETAKLNAEAETENEGRKITIENIKQEGWGKLLDNIRKEWEHGDAREGEGWTSIRSGTYEKQTAISNTPRFNEKEAAEIAKLVTEAELNTEKKKGYWEELLNATKKANADEIKAAAIKLAAEWETGEYTNWKTWQRTATEAIGGISKIIGLGH